MAKMPRTRENYPNQRVAIKVRISPKAMEFLQDKHWELRQTISATAFQGFEYILANKEDFIQYCKDTCEKK